MSTQMFNTTNMFWQQCQDTVVRIERTEHDNKGVPFVMKVGMAK